jgi:FAD/FMN-containing dehydrogenase
VADAVEASSLLRRSLPTLDACELFLSSGVELVRAQVGMPPLFAGPHPVCLLVEASDRSDPTNALAEATASVDGVLDTLVATEPEPQRALWRYREAHTEAINALGPPHKLDVTLPQAAIAPFVDEVPSVVTAIDDKAEVWLFGHVGDGNVHVNVTGVAPDDDRIDDAVFRLVASAGGSISAEHGIGTAKKRWLALSRSPSEISAFRAVKGALDPDGILNPNVLL